MSTSIRVVKSSLFLLAIQMVQRSLGIISTLILARLLTPEHFGIVALVTIALQFFELLVETGTQQYIVQKDTLTDDDLSTAWSMDILIKSAIASLVITTSPWIATYFETPELMAALSVAALALPIRALRTPGLMQLAREINYQPVFKLTLWQKGLSFITVITLALLHPSHWAIIIGNLVSAVILALGSYRVHNFRPRWTLKNVGQQWQFSRWLLMRGMVGFTRSQIDNLMVAKFFNTPQLGGYNLVREVSLLPALSAIIPMSEPLLAAIAQSKYDAASLAYRVRLSLALMITVLTPITTFIMLYPELIIKVLLGSKWIEFAPLLQPFGLFFFTFCLFALTSDAIIALGRVKALFAFDLTSTLIIIGGLFLVATSGLQAMAWTRGWLAVVTSIALLLVLEHWVRFNLIRLIWLCLPTITASIAAGWLITLPDLAKFNILGEFLLRGTLFVAVAGLLICVFSLVLLGRSDELVQLRSLAGTFKKNVREF